MVAEENPIVFLDIRIGEERVGRVVLELFKHVCPLTSENFRALCTGEKGIGSLGKPLHYKGSLFHKTVTQFMIQGGDITDFNGCGGESIYSPYFRDENFTLLHSEPGCLSMANAGPDSNNSQFFITTVPCPHLDKTNVAFGKVRAGLGVVEEVSRTQTDKKDRPFKDCVIYDCGELLPDSDWEVEEKDCTEDTYPPFPEDWQNPDTNLSACENVISKIKSSGNHFFTNLNYVEANRKYKKAMRYVEWSKIHCDKTAEKSIRDTEINCLLNLAAVNLKMGSFRIVLEHCNEVLKLDSKSTKAFYRRGQARVRLNDYELALVDFRDALALLPNDKSIKHEIKSVKKIMKSYLVIEKDTFKKMLT